MARRSSKSRNTSASFEAAVSPAGVKIALMAVTPTYAAELAATVVPIEIVITAMVITALYPVITGDCRIWVVPAEDRVWVVPVEDRVYEVVCG